MIRFIDLCVLNGYSVLEDRQTEVSRKYNSTVQIFAVLTKGKGRAYQRCLHHELNMCPVEYFLGGAGGVSASGEVRVCQPTQGDDDVDIDATHQNMLKM